MNILFLDYLSTFGHRVFNSIHIRSMLNLGYSLVLVGKENMFYDFSENRKEISIINIPNKLFFGNTSLSARISSIIRLLWLKKNINFNNIDFVIVPTYDILSFIFFRTNKKLFIINHNNVDQLDNAIKLKLTRLLPSNYIHIALNEYMKERLSYLLPKKKVLYVPHGYLEPSSKIKKPTFVNEGDKFILCPVNRNYDSILIKELIRSERFNKFLSDNSLILFLKPQLCSMPIGNVRVLGNLADDEYNYMLSKSVAVILPYGKEFKYRCSGILFECVARNTPIIATELQSFKYLNNAINIHFFNNIDSLINVTELVLNHNADVFDSKLFLPDNYWKQIIINESL